VTPVTPLFVPGRDREKFTRPATVGKLIGLDASRLNHALGSAGTRAAGLWEFPRDIRSGGPVGFWFARPEALRAMATVTFRKTPGLSAGRF
jgi:hypothetical protein